MVDIELATFGTLLELPALARLVQVNVLDEMFAESGPASLLNVEEDHDVTALEVELEIVMHDCVIGEEVDWHSSR